MDVEEALTSRKVKATADRLNVDYAPHELEQLVTGVKDMLEGLEIARRTWNGSSSPVLERTYKVPEPAENPYNAWTVRSSFSTEVGGILAARTIAVKDNIAVAGLPLRNGSDILEGYIAELDAEVVTRVLRAGGTIAGKAQCEDFCLSVGSHTCWGKPVLNPVDPTRTTGGSSSGCAALVASGSVDMAIGGDQGGSIRIPSSFCGIVGLKPTWGRVPYTGAMSIEPMLDHLGPMTKNIRDNLLLFSVLAGEERSVEQLDSVLQAGISDLRFGVLKEGFGQTFSEPEVDWQVRNAIGLLASENVFLQEVSVPEHVNAALLWTTLSLSGVRRVMFDGGGFGDSALEHYPRGLIARMRDARATLTLREKQFLLAAEISHDLHGGEVYAFGRATASVLRQRYDAAFEEVDILLMPTTPHRAPHLPRGNDLLETNAAAVTVTGNTTAFNISHHPALSMPCGSRDGLPVGLTLVARRGAEDLLYRAGAWLEARIAG